MGIFDEIEEKRKQRKFEREAFRLFGGKSRKPSAKAQITREVSKPAHHLTDYFVSARDSIKSKFKRAKKKLKKSKKEEKAKAKTKAAPISLKRILEQKPKVMTPPVERAYKFREKELKRYSKVYLGFMFLSLLLSILALLKKDFFSYAIAMLILVLDFLCYRQTLAPEERKYAIYLMAWPFILTLNVASIIEVNILAFVLSIVAMLIATLTPTLMKRRVSAEKITKFIQVPPQTGAKIETDLDRLLSLLQKLGKMKLSEIAGTFDISREKAEEWARIMEDNDFAYIRYPPFGEVELVLGKEKKGGEKEKSPKEK